MASRVPRIIILGSGFAGIAAAKQLGASLNEGEAEVLLVSKTNHTLFTPMAADAATGAINVNNAVESARVQLRGTGVHLVVTDVTSIDLDKKRVIAADCELPYEYLIIATGSTTNFFGVPGAAERCLVLKDFNDIQNIRAHITDQFEKASRLTKVSDRKKALSFAFIGGGPTGIELVTGLNDLVEGTMSKLYPQIDVKKEVQLTVLDMAPFILMPFPEDLRAKALAAVEGQGIKVLLKSSVTAIVEEGIQLGDGSIFPAATVFWTAGVRPNLPEIIGELAKDKGGRLTVERELSLPGRPEVFCIGDSASFMEGERPLPMVAQVAVRQGPVAAKNLVARIREKPTREFTYKSQGTLAALGSGKGVADAMGMHLSGWIAWVIWRFVYLLKFESWNRRFRILGDWFVEMFTVRDITK
jgi:NADH:ubiquinone reductase (H+-translocating)